MKAFYEKYEEQFRQIGRVFALIFILMLLAHGFRFFELAYSDDSVQIVQSTSTDWKISIGRWAQPFYWKIRGDIAAPWLMAVLACIFLALSATITIKIMGIRSRWGMLLLCLALTANPTMSYLNSTFIMETDTYMLALLLAVLSVSAWKRWRGGFLLSACFICISTALYQSYIGCAAVLMLAVLAKSAIEESWGWKKLLGKGITALAALLGGLVLYKAGMDVFLARAGLDAANSYNSPVNVGNLTLKKIPTLLKKTYLYPFRYLSNPLTHLRRLSGVLYLAFILLTLVCLVLILLKRRPKPAQLLFALLFTAFMPLGMNMVYFISGGWAHSLMIYAYFLAAAYPVWLLEKCDAEISRSVVLPIGSLFISVVLFFNNMVFANQMYVRRDLEFQSTLSLATRIIDRIEQVDGYKPGQTQVALMGTLYDSPLTMRRPGFEHLDGNGTVGLLDGYGTNNDNYYAICNPAMYPWYFWQVLGYPLNLVDDFTHDQLAKDPEIRNMPVFPTEGCIQWKDGETLILKIGVMDASYLKEKGEGQ
ncbi:MAG: glucosyltransferase domain-containing protein [Clostridia bacterium]|nr:glucosyltransferase domain-containing protein [Clostridia bacterium]